MILLQCKLTYYLYNILILFKQNFLPTNPMCNIFRVCEGYFKLYSDIITNNVLKNVVSNVIQYVNYFVTFWLPQYQIYK